MLKQQRMTLMLALLFGFVMLTGWSVRAQSRWTQAEDFPRAEVFAGYSYASLDRGERFDRLNLNGWAASVNGNLNRHLGLTGDFAGHYGSNFHVHEFLFGPTVSLRTRNVTGFGRVLVGSARLTRPDLVLTDLSGTSSLVAGRSTTKLAMGVGGGVDFNVSRNFAIRGIEVDYLPVRFGGDLFNTSRWTQNVRIKTGAVLKF